MPPRRTDPSRRLHLQRTAHLLLLAPLLLAGCRRTPAADVVATVNKHPITTVELDRAFNDQRGDGAGQNEPLTGEAAAALRLGLLRDLIDQEIVEQRAAKMNLTATPEEVDAKFDAMKAPYSEEEFQARLADRHTSVEDIKRDLRRSLTINKLLNKEINSKINVTDADIQTYFNAHKSEYNNIETNYHLAQIVVTDAPETHPGNLQGNKAGSDADARKKILALKNRIDSGEDFGALAMNFSENPSTSPNGGDMGLIPQSQLQQNSAVFAAIDKLKPGQTTEIIPFPDPADPKKIGGYAIFELIGKEPAGQHDVSEPQVQQRIREGLQNARSQLLKAAYFEMLRDQAKVENFYAEQIFKDGAR